MMSVRRNFIQRLFDKADTIGHLEVQVSMLMDRLSHAEGKLDLTEKALVSERRAKDKIVLRYADQVSKQAGLHQHFVNDAVESKPDEPEQLMSEYKRGMIESAARRLREHDLEKCRTDEEMARVPPVEEYVSGVMADEDFVFGTEH